jgi:hypothetical protein
VSPVPPLSEFEALTKIVAPFGIGGLLAAFMFLLYRRDMTDRIASMERARERDKELQQAVTKALDRSTDAHERAIQESAQNRQLFLDLRAELTLWRQSGHRRREDVNP